MFGEARPTGNRCSACCCCYLYVPAFAATLGLLLHSLLLLHLLLLLPQFLHEDFRSGQVKWFLCETPPLRRIAPKRTLYEEGLAPRCLLHVKLEGKLGFTV